MAATRLFENRLSVFRYPPRSKCLEETQEVAALTVIESDVGIARALALPSVSADGGVHRRCSAVVKQRRALPQAPQRSGSPFVALGVMGAESVGQIGAHRVEAGVGVAARCGGSKVATIYDGAGAISERHRHRYEVNTAYRARLEACGVDFAGMSPDGLLPETIELKDHPWFIGVQYHPELKSRPFEPHPLFASFVAAAKAQSRLV